MSKPIIVRPQKTEVGDDEERYRDIIAPMMERLLAAMSAIIRESPGSTPADMIRALSLSLAGFYASHLTEEGRAHPPQAAANLAQRLMDDFASAMRHRRRMEWAAQQPGG